MGKQVIDISTPNDGLGTPLRDGGDLINKNFTELYDEDVEIAGIKTFSSFPVTPSSAPTTDYQVANKKYVDDSAGGGGSEFQIYDFIGWMDAGTPANWQSVSGLSPSPEINTNIFVPLTSSVLTITDDKLKVLRPVGVAEGAQTVNSLRMWIRIANDNIWFTNVAVIKVTFSDWNTVSSKAILIEKTLTTEMVNGYIDFTAADFADTAISDKDILYAFYGSPLSSDIYPLTFRLKSSID